MRQSNHVHDFTRKGVVLIAELLIPWYKHRIDYAYSKVLNN